MQYTVIDTYSSILVKHYKLLLCDCQLYDKIKISEGKLRDLSRTIEYSAKQEKFCDAKL